MVGGAQRRRRGMALALLPKRDASLILGRRREFAFCRATRVHLRDHGRVHMAQLVDVASRSQLMALSLRYPLMTHTRTCTRAAHVSPCLAAQAHPSMARYVGGKPGWPYQKDDANEAVAGASGVFKLRAEFNVIE